MNAASILDEGYICVISPNGTIATHRVPDMVLQPYDSAWLRSVSADMDRSRATGGEFTTIGFSDVTNEDMQVLGRGREIGHTGRYWVVCGFVPMRIVNQASTEIVLLVLGLGAAIIVVMGLLSFLLIGRNLKKLPVITSYAEKISNGDMDISINRISGKTNNEISLLENAFANVIETIRRLVCWR